MKNYKSLITLALLACCTFFSCNEEIDQNLTSSKVYITQSGVQEIELYNTGRLYAYPLGIYKSGAIQSSATVRIAVFTQEELDNYNTINGTNYKLIGAENYSIEKQEVHFSDDLKDVNQFIQIMLDPDKIKTLQDDRYVLPIKILESSLSINETKSECIIHPEVTEPVIYFKTLSSSLDYAYGSADLSSSIKVALNASNEWTINCEVAVDESYLEIYNAGQTKAFVLLPEELYTLEKTATIASSGQEASFSLGLKISKLSTGRYLLPVRLSSVSKFTIQESASLHLLTIKIVTPLLDRGSWTITANTEELVGEAAPNGPAKALLDGNADSFWHSQWKDGWQDTPHNLIIDMKNEYTITDIDLIRRNNNTDTKKGEFYISTDGVNWTKVGTFTMADTNAVQSFQVTETKGRYLMVKITQANGNVSSLAEIMPHGI